VHTPPVDAGKPRRIRYTPRNPRPHQPPTRRQRVTAIMSTDPGRAWTGRELAEHLHIKSRNMLTQLAEWTRLGFLARTGAGAYTLAPP
jgi:hypothetical protein